MAVSVCEESKWKVSRTLAGRGMKGGKSLKSEKSWLR